ncbi:MAG: M15 family metallopeptidase [Clostridium sp.]|nr:M15 family metallopeptidase [Clostridium sp.]
MIKQFFILTLCINTLFTNTLTASNLCQIKDTDSLININNETRLEKPYTYPEYTDINYLDDSETSPDSAPSEKDYDTQMKQDLLILMMAYPEYITGIEKNDSGKVYVVMKSGKKFIYDDKLDKTPEQKFESPDLQDIMADAYPLDKNDKIPDKSYNPGRCRNYEFLNEVYGGSRASIEKNLLRLKYGYPTYQFNSHNNANTCLEAALKEIVPISKGRGDVSGLLYPGCGTYNYRVIAGTGKLSPHSYGIAIDLNTDKRDYWKWSTKDAAESRVKEYPIELVTAFENNNFIWGGKWGHFDIMHFEYRPEIILKARYFSNYDKDSKWYTGVPEDDENTQKYIDLIEKSL